MNRRATQGSTIVALVAAVLLVAQAFLTAWAAGAMPLGPQLDVFGNPLCINGAHQDGGGPATDHPGLPDCCAFGCGMVSPLLPVPAGESAGVVHSPASSGVHFPWATGFPPSPPAHDPGSPRAPPVTA
ncbi:MAG: hypothetical protein ABTQ31_20115 [Rhizobiaceae bacterium]